MIPGVRSLGLKSQQYPFWLGKSMERLVVWWGRAKELSWLNRTSNMAPSQIGGGGGGRGGVAVTVGGGGRIRGGGVRWFTVDGGRLCRG
jgi:hypothetical protein